VRPPGTLSSTKQTIIRGLKVRWRQRHVARTQSHWPTRLSKHDAPEFMSKQTWDAIKAAKASKAIVPDSMLNIHLKHLGLNGILFLTEPFNMSLRRMKIPYIWLSSIVPLLKRGKDAFGQCLNYRRVRGFNP